MRKSKVSCTRKFHICAGHRVLGHEGKCQQPHGHNYTIYAHATSTDHINMPLDNIGRVVDFSVIKKKLGDWLEEYWDHKFVLYEKDYELIERLKGFKTYLLPDNPTAENLAKYLICAVCPVLFWEYQIEIFKVDIWETDNCLATVELDKIDDDEK